jgi:hypothetical protein
LAPGRPPYSRAKWTPCADALVDDVDADLRESVNVALASAEVAALDRVVEQALDAVAVVLVVLAALMPPLRGDRMRAARRILVQ